jgi:ankyrin repeat protein
MIKLLLFPACGAAAKADLVRDLQWGSKKTRLHYACRGGHIEKVRLLLQAGAIPNMEDEEGDTPLIVASIWGHVEIVELLLQAIANLHHTNHDNQSALHVAIDQGHILIVKTLLSFGYCKSNMLEREEDPLLATYQFQSQADYQNFT